MFELVLSIGFAIIMPFYFGVMLFRSKHRKSERVLYIVFLVALFTYGVWNAVQAWQRL